MKGYVRIPVSGKETPASILLKLALVWCQLLVSGVDILHPAVEPC